MDEKVKNKSNVEECNFRSSLEPNKRKKEKHKERKNKHGTDKTLYLNGTVGENCVGDVGEGQACSIDRVSIRSREEEGDVSKKKKKKRTKDIKVVNSNTVDDKLAEILDVNQKSKLKKRKNFDDSSTRMQETGSSKSSKKGKMTRGNDFKNNEGDPLLDIINSRDANEHSRVNEFDAKSNDVDHYLVAEVGKDKEVEKVLSKKVKRTVEGEGGDQGKKIKKRKSSDKSKSKERDEVDDQGMKMKIKKRTKAAGTDESPNSAPGGTSKPKRVTFSDQVEVCCDGLIRGKRFTPEEDKTIKEAVLDYIESHGLGDEGLKMVLYCRSHPDVKNCWKEIGAALPYRPRSSVYYRAHILFERDTKRKWTAEELDFVKKVQEQHGSDWKSIAEALGKNRFHVKDAWRRIKYANIKNGHWSQEEYQQLFDLVNLDLCARALEDYRKAQHGMFRDNISWEAISNKLTTRSSSRCCKKWYEQLTSPMVSQGVWSDTDDYRLMNALFVLDACCMEEVDWDNLLEHRSGDVCRKRWNQMVQHIGEHGRKSFSEQVEILAKRFCPDLVEAREAFDNKPMVC